MYVWDADPIVCSTSDSASNCNSWEFHLDLDSLDTSEGHANKFAVSGGITRTELLDCMDALDTHASIVAATLSAYDPEFDEDDRIGHIALEVAARLLTSSSA